MGSVEYLGKIGYKFGKAMQAFLIHSFSAKEMYNKKIILLGVGENAFYAEMLLKQKGIEIFAYADNSKKVQGYLRGKKVYSPFELFNNNDYYFIITVHNNNINRIRLQLRTHKIMNYSIFINTGFHDFVDEDDQLQETMLDAINIICFKEEGIESALPYCHGNEWQPA